jgi:hypothetical protein
MRGILWWACVLGCGGAPSNTDKLVQLDTLVDGGAGDAGAELRLIISDENHAAAAARVSIWQGSRDSVALMPSPAMHARYQPGWNGGWVRRIAWIYADGDITLPVPPGQQITIEVQRGLEYRPISITRDVPMGFRRDVTISLERWINEAANGWWSGDSHIHRRYGNDDQNPNISIDDAARMIRGEDLNVANLLAANKSSSMVYDMDQVPAMPQSLSARYLYQFNAEFRLQSPYGHSLHLGRLTSALSSYFSPGSIMNGAQMVPTNCDAAEETHGAGGIVVWAHPTYAPNLNAPLADSIELPVAAAIGLVDAVDILHPSTDENGSSALYYKLLNTGIKLAATGATDVELDADIGNSDRTGLPQAPPGTNRVYVKLANGLSDADWLAGMKARHTFCTNGPMLDMTVEGRPIGESFDLPRPSPSPAAIMVRVQAHAKWRNPLNELQIVVNGVVMYRQSGPNRDLDFDQVIPLSQSSWIAARINEQGGSGDVSDQEVFAHTSPVWVTIGGAPQRSSSDAAYLLDAVNLYDRLMMSSTYPDMATRNLVLDRINRARVYYQNQ